MSTVTENVDNYDKAMEAILAQSKPAEKKAPVDKKFPKEVLMTKYFNPMVTKGQSNATFTFRILPTLDGSSPFQEIKLHTGIKYGGKWQKFICLSEYGEDCPLCDTEAGLKAQGDKEGAKVYRASSYYVVKGIDRAKESEGVKYWRFKKKYDGTGAFDKIATLITLFGNILKPTDGYDLIISCSLDAKGYSVISSINCVKPSPLSTNEALAQSWLNEDSTWKDVFSKKDAQYLTEIVSGTAAYWDDNLKKFVNPAQLAKEQVAAENAMIAQPQATATSTIANNDLLKGENFDDTTVEEDELPF